MSTTNYAILRVKRVKTKADLAGATRHGRREDTGTHFDPERTPYNLHWSACQVTKPVDWVYGVERAVARTGATTRQGATVAAEFLVAASPQYFEPPAPPPCWPNCRPSGSATLARWWWRPAPPSPRTSIEGRG